MVLDPLDAELISRLMPEERVRHGVPTADDISRREAAAVAARRILGGLLVEGGLRVSPLGPGWSSDIDLHVTTSPPPDLLLANDWLPLQQLLRRLGSTGNGRWGVVVDGRMLTGADITTEPVPDALASVRGRALRRGEVRLREVLELRLLQRKGLVLPTGDVVVQAAANLETALGGDELRAFAGAAPAVTGSAPLPVSADVLARLRREVGACRTRRRVVVGVNGVDGSGKSSLTRRLADDLIAAGVPASVVWTRPGMRLRVLASSARLVRQLLGHGKAPTVRAVAGGATDLPSRRGVVGWLWAMCVSAAFCADVRRRHVRAHGVVLYDRHLLDALVTIEFVYAGVSLRLPKWLARRAVPPALLSLYLDAPVETVLARKPGDTFGEHAIRRQLELYAAHLSEYSPLIVLDGRRSLDQLTLDALKHLTLQPAGP